MQQIVKNKISLIKTISKFVPWKDRKAFCADMKKIYNAINEEQALSSLSERALGEEISLCNTKFEK